MMTMRAGIGMKLRCLLSILFTLVLSLFFPFADGVRIIIYSLYSPLSILVFLVFGLIAFVLDFREKGRGFWA